MRQETKQPAVYDPDPTNAQLQDFGSIGVDDLEASDLSNPAVVKLLLNERRITLIRLQQSDKKAEELSRSVNELRQERENLRVSFAEKQTEPQSQFAEVLVGALIGFAINILTSDAKSKVGWVMLVLGLGVLLLLKLKPAKKEPKVASKTEGTKS